jgi:hypothetical protein
MTCYSPTPRVGAQRTSTQETRLEDTTEALNELLLSFQ